MVFMVNVFVVVVQISPQSFQSFRQGVLFGHGECWVPEPPEAPPTVSLQRVSQRMQGEIRLPEMSMSESP